MVRTGVPGRVQPVTRLRRRHVPRHRVQGPQPRPLQVHHPQHAPHLGEAEGQARRPPHHAAEGRHTATFQRYGAR